MSHRYRYIDGDGDAVLKCPICGTRWDMPRGVTLTVSVDGMLSDHETRLTGDGSLVDVNGAVEHGYHSDTTCGDCGKRLIDMEGVYEEEEIR